LSLSVVFPTSTLPLSYDFTITMSFCIPTWWVTIIIPTSISFVTYEAIVVDCVHLFYFFFFVCHIALV
jgi:hypothetical protein